MPEWAVKISPKRNVKPLLNVPEECLGQVHLIIWQIKLGKDLPILFLFFYFKKSFWQAVKTP